MSISELKLKIIVCNANDTQSNCAQGCKPTSFDENVLTEEEIPNVDEEFESISEINYEISMKVEADDEKSLEDIAKEIESNFQAIFEDLNPFPYGVTNVTVSVEQAEIQKRRKRDDSLCFESDEGLLCPENEDLPPAVPPSSPPTNLPEVKEAPMALDGNATVKVEVTMSTEPQKCGPQGCKMWSEDMNATFSEDVDKKLQDECSKLENCGEIEISAAKTTKPDNGPKVKLYKWMESLPEKLKNLPLTMLAIPGTHQSRGRHKLDQVIKILIQ